MSFGWRSEDQPGSASRVVQERTHSSARNSGQHFSKFAGAHTLALLPGPARSHTSAGSSPVSALQSEARSPVPTPNLTPAGSELGGTPGWAERALEAAGACPGARGSPARLGGTAAATSSSSSSGGGGGADGAGSRRGIALRTRRRRWQLLEGRLASRQRGARLSAGASLTFLFHEFCWFGAFEGEEASRGLGNNLRPRVPESGKGGSFQTL